MRKLNDVTRIQLPFNFEAFENGKVNVLLITGNRYIGKSTLAERYSKKYNAIWIELDNIDFENPEFKFHDTNKIEYKWLNEFLKDHEELNKIISKFGDLRPEQYDELMKGFMPYLVNKCLNDKENKYIIEGIQIYRFSNYIDINLPMIVLISQKNYNKFAEEADPEEMMGILRQAEWQVADSKYKIIKISDANQSYIESVGPVKIIETRGHFEAILEGKVIETADVNELNELRSSIIEWVNRPWRTEVLLRNEDRIEKVFHGYSSLDIVAKIQKAYGKKLDKILFIKEEK